MVEVVETLINVFTLMFFSKNDLLKLPIEVSANSVADFLIKKQFIIAYSLTVFPTAEHFNTVFKQLLKISTTMNQNICCFNLSDFEGLIFVAQVNSFI
ncbi:MAG: hypothetical protein MHPSP_002302, partial [Paramarteilia canceri]